MSSTTQEQYDAYYENFMKQKHDRLRREEQLNERLTAMLGVNAAGVSIIGDYETHGDPMTYEEYLDWLSKADEREEHKKQLEKEREERMLQRVKEAEDNSKKFKAYIETLPKMYNVKEWRTVAKTLPIKLKPIPRGTKAVEVTSVNNNAGIEVRYLKV